MEPARKKRRGADQVDSLGIYTTIPLKPGQTRKLRLLPATSRNDPLYADLSADAPSSEQYEALSYTWENEAKPCTIHIGTAVLSIGQNLDAALRQFRLSDTARWLWVDAICIDQGSDAERTSQIAMMRTIYRCANATLSWLGPDSAEKDGQSTIGFFRWLLLSDKAKKQLKNEASHKSLESIFKLYNARPQSEIGITLERLVSFCQRRYFMRRWILQEVGVARDSQFWCGDTNISGYDLADSASLLLFDCSPVPITTPFMRFMSLKRPEKYHASSKKSSRSDQGVGAELTEAQGLRALGALERFREFECFDGRDRIASLAWVDENSRLFSVVYDRWTEEVFYQFARTAVNLSPHCLACTLSSAARRPRAKSTAVPSWVPDWRVDRQESEVRLRLTSPRSKAMKSKTRLLRQTDTSTHKAEIIGSRLRLKLQGFHESPALVVADSSGVLEANDLVVSFLEDSSLRFNVAGKLRAVVLREESTDDWRVVAALELALSGKDASLVDVELDIV